MLTFSKPIDYLGHIIAPGNPHVATGTTKAFKALLYPTTVLELQSFLGLCNVYRRFVTSCAKPDAPLDKKLKKEESFQFNLDEKR